MERKINVNTDKVTVIKGDNWDNITSIDFGGAEVEFDRSANTISLFSGDTVITSVTNGIVLNQSITYLFSNCPTIETVDIFCPTTTGATRVFSGCSSLTSVTLEAPMAKCSSLFNGCTELQRVSADFSSTDGSVFQTMFRDCSKLRHVEFVVLQSIIDRYAVNEPRQCGVPSSAPCNAFVYWERYTESHLADDLVKITFSDQERPVGKETNMIALFDYIHYLQDGTAIIETTHGTEDNPLVYNFTGSTVADTNCSIQYPDDSSTYTIDEWVTITNSDTIHNLPIKVEGITAAGRIDTEVCNYGQTVTLHLTNNGIDNNHSGDDNADLTN